MCEFVSLLASKEKSERMSVHLPKIGSFPIALGVF